MIRSWCSPVLSSGLLLFLLVQLTGAQPALKFSGYAMTLPGYQASTSAFSGSGGQQFFNLGRARLRPTLLWGDNTRLVLEYEVNTSYQSAALVFSGIPEKTNRQRFDWSWNPVTEDHWLVSHAIDRLSLRREFEHGNLEIGRQRVAWGTGRIWNPTDLFNPINPASFEKIEKDGADLISTQLYLGNFTDLTLVYNPQDYLRSSNAGFRYRSNYRTCDYSVAGGYFDKRVVLGGDFAGNLLNAGIRAEGILSASRKKPTANFAKYILGVDFQFTPEIYALLEYQYNGAGAATRRNYDLPALLSGEIVNLSKNYLFLQSSIQFHPLVNGIPAINMNLNDSSGFVLLTLSISLKSNADVAIGAQLPYGETFDEYSYYSGSWFLQGTYYF